MKSLSEEVIEYTIDVLKDLISIPTVNPPGENYKKISDYLEKKLSELGMKTEIIEIPEDYLDRYYPYSPAHKGYPRYIVYARIGEDRPLIHFNGHYDVVPPGTGWSKDPFKPYFENDKFFGRGSSDMKGGIAAVLGLIKHLVDNKMISGKTIETIFVPDEEAGGVGTRYYVEKKISVPDYVIIAESTSHRRINIGHKGMVRGVVKVYGKQVHGSVPWKGRNAFLDAARISLRFYEEYQKILTNRATKAPVEAPEARHPTINLGGYAESTSRKDNIVPGEFIFSFDRRVIPEENITDVEREIKDLFNRIAQEYNAKIDVNILSSVPPSLTSSESKVVKISKECVKEVLKIDPWIGISYGRDDGVYYRSIGVETITYGPGVEGTAHMPDEYTSISDIEKVLKTYSCIVERLR
jgi:succinyl-diaminopimelate desuccinylase